MFNMIGKSKTAQLEDLVEIVGPRVIKSLNFSEP